MKNPKQFKIPADKIVPAKVMSFYGIYEFFTDNHTPGKDFVMIEHLINLN